MSALVKPAAVVGALKAVLKHLLSIGRKRLLASLTLPLLYGLYMRYRLFPRGLPYHSRSSFLGVMLDYLGTMHDGTHLEFLRRILDKSGSDTVVANAGLMSWLLGGRSIFVVTRDPVVVERVLKSRFHSYVKGFLYQDSFGDLLGGGIFAVDGQSWYHQRKTAARMFTAKRFENHIWQVLERQRAKLLRVLADQPGQTVDLFNVFLRFTLDSIGEIGFGRDIGSLNDPEAPFLRAFDVAQRVCSERLAVPHWKLLRLLNVGGEAELKHQLRLLNDYAMETVRLLRGQPEDQATDSFVSLFIRTMERDGTPYDDTYLRDLVLNFLIAGRDTTAHALSWLMYLLMAHPEVQEKIVAEVREVVGDGPLAYRHLEGLKYTQAAIDEGLRLFPSVPRIPKLVVEDDVLANGAVIPRGTLVLLHIYAMGRSEKIWGPDADQFRPERWLAPDFVRPSQFEYPVFNAGDRLCLGMKLAWVEMRACLATILPAFHFELAVPRDAVLVDHSLTNGMVSGMPVRVVPRAR